jgi:RND superfamily putative drug exporter
VGFSVAQRDIRDYYNGDIEWIIIVTLIVVFLILVMLLRAIVAPIYLVLSVILSYVSAVGIGVLFFQFVLGEQLSWNVPGMAFLVLVAVGADYNLLLISRIREEAVGRGIRSGVIRTVGSTGGVITSAGLIFAASMFGLTASSISNIVQVGFIIGVGLLLDTFVVRTVTVPAMAVLVGNANWWPSKAAGEKRGKHRAMRGGASTDEPGGEAPVDEDVAPVQEDEAEEVEPAAVDETERLVEQRN